MNMYLCIFKFAPLLFVNEAGFFCCFVSFVWKTFSKLLFSVFTLYREIYPGYRAEFFSAIPGSGSDGVVRFENQVTILEEWIFFWFGVDGLFLCWWNDPFCLPVEDGRWKCRPKMLGSGNTALARFVLKRGLNHCFLLIFNTALDCFKRVNGGGGGFRTRVQKSSTDSSTYLALSFDLIRLTRIRTLQTDRVTLNLTSCPVTQREAISCQGPCAPFGLPQEKTVQG